MWPFRWKIIISHSPTYTKDAVFAFKVYHMENYTIENRSKQSNSIFKSWYEISQLLVSKKRKQKEVSFYNRARPLRAPVLLVGSKAKRRLLFFCFSDLHLSIWILIKLLNAKTEFNLIGKSTVTMIYRRDSRKIKIFN